jgi:hypothetical protein
MWPVRDVPLNGCLGRSVCHGFAEAHRASGFERTAALATWFVWSDAAAHSQPATGSLGGQVAQSNDMLVMIDRTVRAQ